MGEGFRVLTAYRDFRFLWCARTVSYAGDFVTLTAVLLYLQSTGAGPAGVAAALVARAVPQALGPFAGGLADRVDQRLLMIVCDLGRVVTLGAVALLLPPLPVLIGLIVLTSVLSTAFLPAGKSVVPALVPRDRLGPATALLGMSHNLSFAAGPAVGAVLFAALGPRVAFAVDAVSYLLSALLLLAARFPARATGQGTSGIVAGARGVFRDTGAGLRYVAGNRIARTVTLGLFFGVALAAVDNVALVFLLREQLGSGEVSVGVATSLYGVAMVVAPLLLLRSGRADRAGRWFFVAGLGASGAGLLLTGASTTVVLALACYTVAGVGNGLENVACDTLIGSSIPDHLLGRVFGAVYGPIFMAETLAAAVGGALLTVMLPSTLLLLAGAGLLVVAALSGVALLRRPAGPQPA